MLPLTLELYLRVLEDSNAISRLWRATLGISFLIGAFVATIRTPGIVIPNPFQLIRIISDGAFSIGALLLFAIPWILALAAIYGLVNLGFWVKERLSSDSK